MNSIKQLQRQATELVRNTIETVDFGHEEIPGWENLFSYPLTIVGDGPKKHIQIEEKYMIELLKKAESDQKIFDLTVYLASKQVGFGPVKSPALQKFAAGILNKSITKPSPNGRPQKVGSLMDICRYIVALQIADTRVVKLTSGDNTGNLSGCDIAAQAFSENGHPTTPGRIKSICYDHAYSRYRKAANYLLNGEFLDQQTHMDVKNPKNGPQFLRNVPLFFFKT